jgi:hypothetical protein
VADECSSARTMGSPNPESDSLDRLWLAHCSISHGTREKKGQGVWALIGVMFLSAIFIPPSLVLSLILPTYKSRIIAVPALLVIVFWWVASQSNTYNGFNGIIIDPYKLLYLITFTAIGLVIPEYSILKLWRTGR